MTKEETLKTLMNSGDNKKNHIVAEMDPRSQSSLEARYQTSYTEERAPAFMGRAPCTEDMSLARTRASPREKMGPQAQEFPPLLRSRLKSPKRGMPLSADSTTECTKVPLPQAGTAAQAQTGEEPISTAVELSPSLNFLGEKGDSQCTVMNVPSTENDVSITKDNVSITKHYKENESILTRIGKAIQGNFHQGNVIFGENAGSQCVANCLTAAIFQTLKPVDWWTAKDMDSILFTGNELYTYIQASSSIQHHLLLIEELPKQLDVYGKSYRFEIQESLASFISLEDEVVDVTAFNAFKILDAIQMSIANRNACFVCFAGNTILIGKCTNQYYVFDPHARSITGLVSADGRSSCISYHSIDGVYCHIINLFNSMNIQRLVQCEVTGISIMSMDCFAMQQDVGSLYNIGHNEGVAPWETGKLDKAKYQDNSVEIMTSSKSEMNGLNMKSSILKNTLKLDQQVKDDTDKDVIMSSVTNPVCAFFPLSESLQIDVCSRLNINMQSRNAGLASKDIVEAGPPSSIYKISGDGNCFFRALSYNLSNTENHHMLLRKKICEHAQQNKKLFESVMRERSESMDDYLMGMTQNHTWATEFEIIVASHLLCHNIYTFSNGSWLCYSPTLVDSRSIVLKEAIYLEHAGGNHYNVVLDIHEKKSKDDNHYCEGMILKERNQGSHSYFSKRKEKAKQRREKDAAQKKQKRKMALENKQADGMNQKCTESQIDYTSFVKEKCQCDSINPIQVKCQCEWKNSDKGVRGNRRSHKLIQERIRYAENHLLKESKRRASKENCRKLKNIKLGNSKQRYLNDFQYRDKKRISSREKYMDNMEFKDRLKQYSKEKYHSDQTFQNKVKELSKRKYETDLKFRDEIKGFSKRKYETDLEFKNEVKEFSKRKYETDLEFKNEVKEFSKRKYETDLEFKNEVKEFSKRKYETDLEFKNEVKEFSKRKYETDLEFKNEVKEFSKRKYETDLEFKNEVKEFSKRKYETDLEFKNEVKEFSKRKYETDLEFKNEVKEFSKKKYETDLEFKNEVKEFSKRKYETDLEFKNEVKEFSKRKYETDLEFKNEVKEFSKRKYETDLEFKNEVKEFSKNKYETDLEFKNELKERSIKKYKSDIEFQKRLKSAGREKYMTDSEFKKTKIEKSKQQYQLNVVQSPQFRLTEAKRKCTERHSKKPIDSCGIVDKFRENAAMGPTFVCACCQRLLFRNQVQQCTLQMYENKGVEVKTIAEWCISSNADELGCLWICKTCHRKLLSGMVPAECFRNGLQLEEIPECLSILNQLEHHLVALHIPFMKVVNLPKGGQNAINGPVVCVPSNITTASALPRQTDSDLIIRVKLKKKLTFKGHHEYQFVNTGHVHSAIQFLEKENRWYSSRKMVGNQEESTNVEKEMVKESSNEKLIGNDYVATKSGGPGGSHNGTRFHVNTIDAKMDEKDGIIGHLNSKCDVEDENYGVLYDTCLQPCDIGQEVLDHYFDDIFNLAPAEGNNPVKILQTEGNEARSFPVLFPRGCNTYDEARSIPISLSRYFNNRLMHVDSRFARDTQYIFFSQYVSELNQVIEKTQISLRKSTSKTKDGRNISAKTLQDPSQLKELLQNDDALRFMQPIRGTPSYWQNTQKDLFAMLRQIGIPTWFCSFSAAEFRWPDIINVILQQQNDKRAFEDLDWLEKSKILKSNSVTVARMFDHRFHVFLHSVIMSQVEPIGKVKDYFYRVEFQQRGSPHVHCLFWIENAPKLEDGVEDVCDFIDEYVTCQLPMPSDGLREVVENVQQHSKRHSKSCKKGNKMCRFNFPRPPSEKTFIVIPDDEELSSNQTMAEGSANASVSLEDKMDKSKAKELLQGIWDELQSGSTNSTSELFHKLRISQEEFEEANQILSSRKSIIMKRNPNEAWINPYNRVLLQCWDANIDIQYVLDAFSCIVYIVSYISKAEREMGLLLKQTQIEAEEGNLSAKQTMRAVGSAYLNHREVGVQEAVYRICGLHMKECTRKVIFIPVGENPTRLSKPLSQMKKSNSSEDPEVDDPWMVNIIDRYLARPATAEFQVMCLATFCSVFRILSEGQVRKSENVFQLQNDKGFIQRRTRSENAIIRYYRANAEKCPEIYYKCLLQLFLPYWFETQLKPPTFGLYQTFYETGSVKLEGDQNIRKVKDIVHENKSLYVLNEEEITAAEKQFDIFGEQEDAWGNLCPESEVQRRECLNEKIIAGEKDEGSGLTVDLGTEGIEGTCLYTIDKGDVSKSERLRVLRSMNEKQAELFYFVRNWCIENVLKRSPKPFHIFVTGGAGTGKSHLIKAIKYEASHILSKGLTDPSKETVLLTAFTGTAAFNISGCTVHHAFKLQKRLPLPYEPLCEQSLSTLRLHLDDVQILVIDEVSMIFKRLLYYVHERLVQIKQCKEPFGGVSIIAVGDFFQLPPVRQKNSERLYNTSGLYPIDFWRELFSFVELDEIMRQKGDHEFAVMLNTLRRRTLDQVIPSNILAMLKECHREAPKDIMHVYATNAEVDAYNLQMIKTCQSELLEIPSKDFKREHTSGKLTEMQNKRHKKQPEDNDRLSPCLLVAVNARVMLSRNVDVSDGLANGVIGTIVDIVKEENASGIRTGIVKSIGVQFDDERAGRKTAIRSGHKLVVYIERVEDEATRSGVVRHQFPLKLAWACTAHKVQGQTCTEIAVNLNKMFAPGQSYVALSRATSKSGLYIESESENVLQSKIFADKEVEVGQLSMKQFSSPFSFKMPIGLPYTEVTNLILLNIQNLMVNIMQLRCDKRFSNVDAICLTETWINQESDESFLQLEKFSLNHRTREVCYDISNIKSREIKTSKGGGVGVYIKDNSGITMEPFPIKNIEATLFLVQNGKLAIITVYRPPTWPVEQCVISLSPLITHAFRKTNAVVVMGDFNENISGKEGCIYRKMKELGFTQLVKSRTTDKGTIIDHVYVSQAVIENICSRNEEDIRSYRNMQGKYLSEILAIDMATVICIQILEKHFERYVESLN